MATAGEEPAYRSCLHKDKKQERLAHALHNWRRSVTKHCRQRMLLDEKMGGKIESDGPTPTLRILVHRGQLLVPEIELGGAKWEMIPESRWAFLLSQPE